MNILVLGAGTVGISVADELCQRGHSVTCVDAEIERARIVNERLDVRVLHGSASESSILFQAGAFDADLCLAVTGDDETNLVAASIAKAMGAKRTVARVYAQILLDMSTFDYQRHFKIDRLMSLEYLSAMELARAIRQSGSIAFESFARGALEFHELIISTSTPTLGTRILDLDLPNGVRIGSILREGRLKIAEAQDTLESGDRITLIGTHDDISQVRHKFQDDKVRRKLIVIAGGGETGYHLARTLDAQPSKVVIMEEDSERCEYLAARLRHTTVVQSDCTRRDHLEEERVGGADVFVACTGDDENNIMAGVEAREVGAKKILAVVSRPDYANVVAKLGIDHAVSPREVLAKQVVGMLSQGALIARFPLAGGGVDIMELEVKEEAPVTSRKLMDAKLPSQCLIAAVTHNGYVKVPGADDTLHPGDTVVALVDESAAADTLQAFAAQAALVRT